MKKRVIRKTGSIVAGVTLATAALLCALARVPAFAQAPAVAVSQAQAGSYIVGGSPTDAELDKLLEAIHKLNGVEQAEIRKLPGATVLRVRAVAQGTIIITAARNAGFELRQMPTRVYLATGPLLDTDLARLRATLQSLPGVEQLEMTRQAAGIAVRVRGAIDPAGLAAAARPAGFVTEPVSGYVASGPTASTDLARLRSALSKLSGVTKVEMQGLIGGANVVIYGDVKDAALKTAAVSSGYGLQPVSDPTGDTRQFSVHGVSGPEDQAKLREALRGVGGAGEVQIRSTPEGVRVDVTNGAAPVGTLRAAAKSAGFDIAPIESVSIPTISTNRERNTPPAPNERTIDEQTRVGEPAPDFTLLMHDGKSKITLSDSLGKRPVVLIFGSYT